MRAEKCGKLFFENAIFILEAFIGQNGFLRIFRIFFGREKKFPDRKKSANARPFILEGVSPCFFRKWILRKNADFL